MDDDPDPPREPRPPASPPTPAPAAPGPSDNPPVAPEHLPSFSELELHPVARTFAPYAVLSSGLFWLLLALASLLARALPALPFEPGWGWISLFLVLAGWSSLLAWLDARRRGWALRRHDLVYRSGVLWLRTVVVPFARIQHVEAVSGPLERLFGLTRLKCFTAGGMAADLTVLGLSHSDAGRVRQFLLEQIRDDRPRTSAL
jgi:uncharacterized protein